MKPQSACFGPVVCSAAVFLLLAGCTTDTSRYPSLAIRDAERIAETPVPATNQPAATALPLAADRQARLVPLMAQARAAHARFLSHRGRTEALVAAASRSAVASENWSVATVALSDLESVRSDAMIALADLDAIYAAARIGGQDTTGVSAARDSVSALIGEEDAALAALRRRMPG